MKTDHLIADLARDPAAIPLHPVRMGVVLVAMTALCAAVFLALAGIRDGLSEALGNPLVASKTFLPLLLCLCAVTAALQLMRPEGRDQIRPLSPVLVALAAGAVLVIGGFAIQPRELWFAEMQPAAVIECLGFIILISIPALALSIGLMQRGATTEPALLGAVLGCGVSAGAATGYSLYCVQDNPVFFVIWYGIAILTMSALGAIAGARLLRW